MSLDAKLWNPAFFYVLCARNAKAHKAFTKVVEIQNDIDTSFFHTTLDPYLSGHFSRIILRNDFGCKHQRARDRGDRHCR